MTEAREKNLRINSADLKVLKDARNQIDSSLALGAVARIGARKLIDDGTEI